MVIRGAGDIFWTIWRTRLQKIFSCKVDETYAGGVHRGARALWLLIESACPLAQFTSPRSLRGEVEIRGSEFRVRGEARCSLQAARSLREAPHPNPLRASFALVSAPQERGEGAHLAR